MIGKHRWTTTHTPQLPTRRSPASLRPTPARTLTLTRRSGQEHRASSLRVTSTGIQSPIIALKSCFSGRPRTSTSSSLAHINNFTSSPIQIVTSETYELWNWDVAEVFIGDNFNNIRRYKEFEVSPQGEWVDLDVNLDNPPHETGWVWQSGMQVAARIDSHHNTWYGFMRIPWLAISDRSPAAGSQLRINFYRCQGADPDRKYIAWQPVHRPSFHTPECFGILTLAAR